MSCDGVSARFHDDAGPKRGTKDAHGFRDRRSYGRVERSSAELKLERGTKKRNLQKIQQPGLPPDIINNRRERLPEAPNPQPPDRNAAQKKRK